MRSIATPLLLALAIVSCNAVVGWDELTRARASAEGEEETPGQEPTDKPDKSDAGTKDAGGGPRCTPSKPFGAPVALAGPITSSAHETAAALTADELEIFFQRTPGLDGGVILRATRTTIDEPFGQPQQVKELGDSGLLYSPSITADGLSLFYAQLEVSKGFKIMNATRTTRSSSFERPLEVVPLAQAGDQTLPFVTGDGKSLFFSRSVGGGQGRIFRADRDSLGEYVGPKEVAELASGAGESSTAVGEGGLRIFFGSARPGGVGGLDVWTGRRAKDTDPWADFEVVPNVNTADTDWPHWISPDGCRLYLSSVGDQPGDIKVATRPL